MHDNINHPDRCEQWLLKCDFSGVERCNVANSGGYVCTREKGHPGAHVACGTSGDPGRHNLAIWEQEPVPTMSLEHEPCTEHVRRCSLFTREASCGKRSPNFLDGRTTGYACTLTCGHTGPHLACGTHRHNLDTWEDFPPAPEPGICTPGHRLCVNRPICNASSNGWFCTRPPGHTGPHVACIHNGPDHEHNLATWG